MTSMRLGGVQLRILQVLWELGPLSARQITELLARERAIALSTVQTLLRQLEAKQAVAHRVEDRVFYFRATVEPEKVRRRAMTDFLQLFDGSATELVQFLLRHEEFSRDDLESLRGLIDETETESRRDTES